MSNNKTRGKQFLSSFYFFVNLQVKEKINILNLTIHDILQIEE